MELLAAAVTVATGSYLKYYVAAMSLGGAFLLLSLLSGGSESGDASHADADAGGDVGTDLDADADIGGDMGGDADGGDIAADAEVELAGHDLHVDGPHVDSHHADHPYDLADTAHGSHLSGFGGLVWFPFISIRFWVFACTFGGLTGVALEVMNRLSPGWTAALAVVMGYLCGTGAVNLLRYARSTDVSTGMTIEEMIGLEAEVLLPVAASGLGKIRLQTRSGSEDFSAVPRDDAASFARGTRVRVVGFRGARAVVASLN